MYRGVVSLVILLSYPEAISVEPFGGHTAKILASFVVGRGNQRQRAYAGNIANNTPRWSCKR
jgi:hypothetical protein